MQHVGPELDHTVVHLRLAAEAAEGVILRRSAFVELDGADAVGPPKRTKRAQQETQTQQESAAAKSPLDVLGPMPAMSEIRSGKVLISRLSGTTGTGGNAPKHLLK